MSLTKPFQNCTTTRSDVTYWCCVPGKFIEAENYCIRTNTDKFLQCVADLNAEFKGELQGRFFSLPLSSSGNGTDGNSTVAAAGSPTHADWIRAIRYERRKYKPIKAHCGAPGRNPKAAILVSIALVALAVVASTSSW